MFLFISGAARSGKSEWAERAAIALSSSGERIYLATAQPLDDEMRHRIERHQASRQGLGFSTLERPRDLEAILPLLPGGATILLECLGNWTANELFGEDGRLSDAERVIEKIHKTALGLRERASNLLIVSNDLFCDGIRYPPEIETYLRVLGSLHVRLARAADTAVECAFGFSRLAKGRMPDSQNTRGSAL